MEWTNVRTIHASKKLNTFIAPSLFSTECGECQASFIREKSACLAEVSARKKILWKFPNYVGIAGTNVQTRENV